MSTLARGFGTCIAICFAIISYIMYAQYKGGQGKVDLLLGACILSARENQKQRTVIRDTWMKSANISADNNTLIRFVVGSHPCPVHPEDRVDQFGCQEWTPVIFEDMERDFEGFIENETVKDPPFRHITIRALFPVILKRLGIQEIIPLSADPLVVSLFKESDEVDMATVKFSLFDPGIVHNGFRYQPISPLLLQKIPYMWNGPFALTPQCMQSITRVAKSIVHDIARALFYIYGCDEGTRSLPQSPGNHQKLQMHSALLDAKNTL